MECLACHTANIEGARFCAKCGAPLPVQKSADADPLIGKTIGGRYRIVGVLGEGGMGRVYNGEQQMGTSVRKVAVKTLLSQFAKDPQTVARFMREVGTVSELEHPNTIKVYDFGQIEGSGELYIAMELLQGKSLDDVLSMGQPLPPERVDRIVGQVCGSLQEAHDKGIVHRDLKPANIFLTTRAGEEDVVKVLDFGIAKKADSKDTKTEQKLTQQGTILGTPPYMSPEQFTGKELDARSDIYSLGVVVYEMLTGRLPYEADTPWQWMTQHMSAQPFPFEASPMGAHVPQKMKQAVMRALSKDVSQRPASAREFFEELTLGGTRMSVVGLGSGGVGAMPTNPGASTGTAMISSGAMAGAPSGRAGGTQVGEPLFPDMGPGATAPAKTMAGDIGAPPPYGGAAAVPTGGGQVYPAPPAASAKKGGGPNLAVIGLIAFVLIGGGVGGFMWWKGKQGADAGDETASVKLPEKDKEKDKDKEKEKDKQGDSSSSGGTAETPSSNPTADASGTPSSEPTAEASGTPTSEPSTRPTTNPTATGKPTATASTTGPKPGSHPGYDSCCRTVRDASKRQTCYALSNGVKKGTSDPKAVLGTIKGMGVRCN